MLLAVPLILNQLLCNDFLLDRYFDRCLEFIVQCLRKDREKPLVFQAIGLIALCVGDAFQKHIPIIMPQIRNNLPTKDATNK